MWQILVYFAEFLQTSKNINQLTKMKVVHTIKDLQAELTALRAQR